MMDEDLVNNAIKALNKERGVIFKEIPGASGIFRGDVCVDRETFVIDIDFNNEFPLRFPTIRILDLNRFCPHVDRDGKVCLFDDASLLIFTTLPEIMTIDAFDRTISILSIKPGSEEYEHEVAREFNAYWFGKQSWVIYTNISPCTRNEYKELQAVCDVDSVHKYVLVSDTEAESKELLKNHFGCELKNVNIIPCMLIRLRSFAIPSIQEAYSWKQIRHFILKHITASQKSKFNEFLNKKMKTVNRLLLLSIPYEGGDFCVGFRMHEYSGKKYRKVGKMLNCGVDPVITIPIDYGYMLKRGCGRADLKDKSVLLLGCGSIGGYIAANICQAGVGTLDLMDQDALTAGNVHRHILGFADTLKQSNNKADLMKEYLENQYPHVEIDSLGFVRRNADIFIREPNRLYGYDIIISAMGEPTINLAINEVLMRENIGIPFVVCFNEPYGIGGHVIATNIGKGCLRCLYTDSISDDLVPFNGSFVAPGQNFKKSMSGCAGSYTEYSALDSQQTAVLGTRLSIDILQGKINGNEMVSWIGRPDNLLSNGFATSEYYDSLTEKQDSIIRMQLPVNERCPLCKMRNS